MLYTVYRTTNLANGKYYFGVHKTEDPNDSYLGFGKYLKAAVAKYGEMTFRKDVLFIYLDFELAFAKEDELIQCYRGFDPLCMNLRKGGGGGFDYINHHNLHSTTEGQEKLKVILQADPNFLKRAVQKRDSLAYRKSISEGVRRSGKAGKYWTGRRHLRRTIEKMSESAKQQNRTGERNHQFGKSWIENGISEKVVKQSEVASFLNKGWKPGRVTKKQDCSGVV